MATAELSMKVKEAAHRMALQGHTWNRGTSKRTGEQFYVIPSRSEPGVAHWASRKGCTCTGFRRRGNCVHHESVLMHEARERATRPLIMTYEEAYGLEDSF